MSEFSLKAVNFNSFEKLQNFNLYGDYVFKINIRTYYHSIKTDLQNKLSYEELSKSARFRNQNDAQRFIVGKYAIRKLIGILLKQDAANLVFTLEKNKKPVTQGIEFNISHSGDSCLIALSLNPVGIDVEQINADFDYQMLLKDSFSKDEIKFISNSENPNSAFFQLWTRKEAVLKATGDGILDNLNHLPALESNVIYSGSTYNLSTFEPSPGYIATLAKISDNEVLFYSFP